MSQSIVFRFDVNSQIGAGHFVRCAQIAKLLTEKGFVCHAVISNQSLIPNMAISCHFQFYHTLTRNDDTQELISICRKINVNRLLIDHYYADEKYQQHLINADFSWAQFDYYCHGRYFAKQIININPSRTKDSYNHCQLKKETELLVGLDYAVIDDKFTRDPLDKTNSKSVFVSFGAGNTQSYVTTLLDELLGASEVNEIHFVTTSLNKELPAIQAHLHDTKCVIWVDHDNVADIIARCDYGVITCGTMSYELARMGLPFVAGFSADNQQVLLNGWQQTQLIDSVGYWPDCNIKQLVHAICIRLQNFEQLQSRGRQLSSAVDGQGARRIADKLELL